MRMEVIHLYSNSRRQLIHCVHIHIFFIFFLFSDCCHRSC